ncbi:hypothetical protein Acor_50350 [Acrocarpospora corrugata]|uniref:HTH cro/C1-type domain-containing protein n=1 Tax=Acrocarpospora corrugata TaxID=35763 RepID=A0A5M3W3V7_9ACTN|nr:hypothetical protein Acor_50350 [Acrocarpospora corrugata]
MTDPANGLADEGLDPASVRTQEDLVRLLNELHTQAGRPSLRTLAKTARDNGDHLAQATVSDMLSGKRMPGMGILVAFVRACGVTGHERLAEWQRAWIRVQRGRPSPKESRRHAIWTTNSRLGVLLVGLIVLAATVTTMAAGRWLHEPLPQPKPTATDRMASKLPSPSPEVSGTPSAKKFKPDAICKWQGDGRCKAKVTADPTGAASDCSGSGTQGSGSCQVRVK